MQSEPPLKHRLLSESDDLFSMYHDRQLSLTDISEHYGCTRQYIQLIFKELGIPRRSRVEALKNKPRHRLSKYDFSDAEDSFIKANFLAMTDSQLAQNLDRPGKAITYRRLVVLGCKKISRRNFTEAENKFILDNYRKSSDREMAGILNRSLISVTHHRNRILRRRKRAIKGYSPAENNFIQKNYLKMTDGEIAAVLRRTKASVAVHRTGVLRLGKLGSHRQI